MRRNIDSTNYLQHGFFMGTFLSFIFDVFDGSFKRVSRGMITNIFEVDKI
jgi:hypothetical protein